MTGASLIPAALIGVVFVVAWRRWLRIRRAHYIRHFPLPMGLFRKLQQRRPALTLKDNQLIAQGLRQFFLAYLQGGRRHVAMPSQIADDLWHEFILYTRQYQTFCRRAFGGFLHHTPAIALSPIQRQSNAALRRVWWQCCKEENIDPRRPTRLPLLFALDAKLGITDGFYYVPDCNGPRRAEGQGAGGYCGGDFGDSSIDGTTSGFGDGSAENGDGDSGADGGGDSGADGGGDGGCGGGGCGGD